MVSVGLRPIEKKGVIVVRRARERAAFKSRGPSVKRGAGGRRGKRGARIEQSNDRQRATADPRYLDATDWGCYTTRADLSDR